MARSLWDDIYAGSRETRKFLDSENAAMKSILSELGLVKQWILSFLIVELFAVSH